MIHMHAPGASTSPRSTLCQAAGGDCTAQGRRSLQVPTFSPGAKARQMNAVASFLGDERAAKARAKWGRPLKAVVITSGGVLNG